MTPETSFSTQKVDSLTENLPRFSNEIKTVQKRSGQTEDFSPLKLATSIERALRAAGVKDIGEVTRVAGYVITRLTRIFDGHTTPTTADIRTAVAMTFIDRNLNHAAKRFLAHRLEGEAGAKREPVYGFGITFPRYFTKLGLHPYDEIQWELRDARITNEKGEIVFEQKGVETPAFWSQTATNIVVQKYFAGEAGSPGRERSVRQLVDRVAKTMTEWGRVGGYFYSPEDAQIFEHELTFLLVNQYAAFNSPVWFNVGLSDRKQQVSACFIQSVKDDMHSILTLALNEGMLFKYGSGTGTNLSTLRSSKEFLGNSINRSSGPVSFMKAYDSVAGVVKSGGKTRRAAKMVILNAEHPDILDFIRCKAKEEKKAWALMDAGYDGSIIGEAYNSIFYQNANNSVRVTDEFMQAVVDDREWWTRYVKTGEPCEKFPARELMREIAEAAWQCGDPGIQTDTTINTWHTTKNSGRINASNPCVTGDTLVSTKDGYRRITDLVGKTAEIVASDGNISKVNRVWKTGHKPVYELRTKSGAFSLKLTSDHKVFTANRGDVPAIELQNGDQIVVEKGFPQYSAKMSALAGQPMVRGWNFTREQVFSPHGGAVAIKELAAHVVEFATDIFDSLTYVGEEDVYDLEEPRTHHFVANGLVVHNCSEYLYLDDTACNLASMNLMRFRQENGEFDTEAFKRGCETVITAMEIIVGFASYPTPAIEQNSFDHRPLGLGYANLGALIMARGLPYDSDQGRNLAGAITALMSGAAYAQSARIAEKIGHFAAFSENRESMMQVMQMHRDASQRIPTDGVSEDLLEAARKSWDEVLERGWKHGLRNSQIAVLAPTGTISFLMDCDTTGVEPDIALVKYKWLVGGGLIKIVNNTVPEALARLGYTGEQIDDVMAYINEKDTIEGAPHLSPEHLAVFDCAFKPQNGQRSINYMGHLRMMAATQPFISGAISKTVNLPNEATVEDIMNLYVEGWRMGIKAIAIYRDGSKRQQPLTTSLEKDQSKKKVATPEVAAPRRRRLPDERRSITHKFVVGGHEGYITVGLYDDGTPGEIFITMSKEGSVISGLMDSFATSISIAFQYGVPLKTLVNKFVHMRFEPSGFTGHPQIKIAKSMVDYIFRWLALKFLPPEDQIAVGINLPQPGELEVEPPVLHTGVQPQSQTLFEATKQSETAASALQGLVSTFNNTADAPICDTCGAIMVRNAACYKCLNCGSTSGCS